MFNFVNEMNKLEEFYFKFEEPEKSLFLALREIFLAWDDEMAECLKYGSPCFTYRGKILCYHWKDKKGQAYVLFNYGKFLDHPLLESKGRKLMKSVDVNPNEDIPVEVLNEVFSQAKAYIDGLLG